MTQHYLEKYLPANHVNWEVWGLDKRDGSHGEGEFCSLRGRAYSLLQFAGNIVLTPIAPAVFGLIAISLYIAAYLDDTDTDSDFKRSKFWGVVDVVVVTVTSPLLTIVAAITGLFGAVLHPGIVYKQVSTAHPASPAL